MLNTISRIVLAIVFLAASAFAQFGSHDVLYVPTAPSGSCLAGSRIQQVTTGAGPTYTCQSITAGVGTWAQLSGSGGGVSSVGLVGTGNQIVVTGASPITGTGSWTLTLDPAGVFLPSASLTPNGGLDVSAQTLGMRTDCANGQLLKWNFGASTWDCATITVSGGANTALSNLASPTVNTTLPPQTDASFDLGSVSFRWNNLWLAGLVGWTNGSGTPNAGLSSTGAGIVNCGNGTQGDASCTFQFGKAVGTGSTASLVGLGQGTAPSLAGFSNYAFWMAPTTIPTTYALVVPSAGVNGVLSFSSSVNQTGCTASVTFLCGSFIVPTLASIVPNTAPPAGQILVGNVGGTAYATVSVTGDSTLSSAGVITNVKVNGGLFPASSALIGTNSSSQPVIATGHSVSGVLACEAASASGTTYTCTTSPSFTPADLDSVLFETDVANTGSSTLSVNGQVNATIKKQGGSTNLVANDLLANQWTLLIFDGTNWQMQGQLGTAVGGAVSSVSNADGTLTISPTTGVVVASLALGHANTWSALQTFGTNISIGGVTASGATGTGSIVFATSPTLVTPVLGTPASGTLTNTTGLPMNGLVGATAANTITETAVLRPTTFAGIETANLTYPWVFQNTNSTNNNTSGALLVNCAGTDTSPTCLAVNGIAGATDTLFAVYSGGTVTNGVLSGQTQQWAVTAQGVVTENNSLTLSNGLLTVPAGAAGGATITFAGDTAGAGLYRAGATTYGFTGATNEFLRFATAGVKGTSGVAYGMTSSSTSSTGAYDTCWDRQGAGVMRVDANSGCSDGLGKVQAQLYTTTTNCAAVGTSANPSVASCTAASAGSFSCATNASTGTCTVNTTAVTAASIIIVQEDDSLGTRLSVTCNTSNISPTSAPVAARVAATSFTINLGTITTNPECFSYLIIN